LRKQAPFIWKAVRTEQRVKRKKAQKKAPKKLRSSKEQILIKVVLKDAKSVSENVGQEKEEINEGGSSQSVVEDLLSSLVEHGQG